MYIRGQGPYAHLDPPIMCIFPVSYFWYLFAVCVQVFTTWEPIKIRKLGLNVENVQHEVTSKSSKSFCSIDTFFIVRSNKSKGIFLCGLQNAEGNLKF